MRLLNRLGRAIGATYVRERPLLDQILPSLQSQWTVVDIGAGGCRISAKLQEFDFTTTALDVVDHNTTNFPLELYDGRRIPYPDKSFDASLLAFVLHHAEDSAAVLDEAIRVTRKAVIILEDAPNNAFEHVAWRTIDYLLNHFTHDDILIGHHIRTPTDWKRYLESATGRPIDMDEFRNFATTLGLYRHVRLVLHLP